MTLDIGTTLRTDSYRVHRAAMFIEIVDVREAGKRGRKCLRVLVSATMRTMKLLADVAAFVEFALDADTSSETLATALEDVRDLGLELARSFLASFGVEKEPAIEVRTALVTGTFGTRAAGAIFTTMVNGRGLDSMVRAAKPADAARMRAWVAARPGLIETMTVQAFRAAMRAEGIAFVTRG